jgi:hypothetical protein
MKKTALAIMASVLIVITGCSKPVDREPVNNDARKSVVEEVVNDAPEDVAAEENAESDKAASDDGSQGETVETENAAETVAEATTDSSTEASTEASDAVTDAVTAAASASVEVNPDEVKEPEIPEETISEPVEQQAAPEPEKQEEEDKTVDIVFMGDSQFDNARGTGSEIPAYACALVDNAKFYNLAIGGTAASIERNRTDTIEGWSDIGFVGMCYALAGEVSDTSYLSSYPAYEDLNNIDPAKVDFYIIEYGANDYINGAPLSTEGNAYDIRSYRGALGVGINTLRSVSPKAKIILCGPSYCMWYNADGYVIGDSYTVSKGAGTLAEYADVCKNHAEDENFMYIDTMYSTYFDLKITTVDDYLIDGLHYNEKGRQIYATTIAHFINKMLGVKVPELPYMEINSFTFGEIR